MTLGYLLDSEKCGVVAVADDNSSEFVEGGHGSSGEGWGS